MLCKRSGVPHKKDHIEVPLKVLLKCDKCGCSMTGYRGGRITCRWYYKCKTKRYGVKKASNLIHELFTNKLAELELKKEYIEPFNELLKDQHQKFIDIQEAESTAFKNELKAVEKKIDILQEQHYLNGEISTEVYNKLNAKLEFQKHEIQQNISFPKNSSSNMKKCIVNAVYISS